MTPADRAGYLAAVPTSARGIIERALTGKAAPRGAIKAKCLDCSAFDRAEVAACTVNTCPLHPYRPFQSARKPAKTARGNDSRATTGAAGIEVPHA